MKKDVFSDHVDLADIELERLAVILSDIDPVLESDKYVAVLEKYCKVQNLINDARENYESLERIAQEDRKMAASRANKKDDVKIEGIRTGATVGGAVVGGLFSIFGLKKVIDAENDPENPIVIRPSLKGWLPSNPFKGKFN